ncbi:MAG: hypothetical protein HN704_03075 [Bacteroidetes bacterium]|jgi:photosystem II stability/assembly factor-like uncharacterized protein|nr:hypothetical protein [Bacteroidota bacterium]MBT7142390.1 hypothetical protein [Bacteroidota bacterium]MBT7490571.1 hypothetical protein [Bacteroidota bacterium]
MKKNASIYMFILIMILLIAQSCKKDENGFNINQQWEILNIPDNRGYDDFVCSLNKLMYGFEDDLYFSNDNGNTWNNISNEVSNGTSITSFYITNNNLYVSTSSSSPFYEDGIYVSANEGKTWTNIGEGLHNYLTYLNVYTLYVNEPNIIVYNGGYLIFTSEDSGNTWSVSNLSGVRVTTFVSYGTTVYAGTDEGLYSSNDNGMNWTLVSVLDSEYVISIAIKGTNIFVGTTDNVFFSNNGSSWSTINNGLPSNIYSSSVSISGNYVFAGISSEESGGVYFSDDNGDNWVKINNGLTSNVNIENIEINDHYIFASADDDGLWRRPL